MRILTTLTFEIVALFMFKQALSLPIETAVMNSLQQTVTNLAILNPLLLYIRNKRRRLEEDPSNAADESSSAAALRRKADHNARVYRDRGSLTDRQKMHQLADDQSASRLLLDKNFSEEEREQIEADI